MAQRTITQEGGAFLHETIVDINDNFTDLYASAPVGALTSGHILVGNSGNVATDVAMSGDVTLANTGAATIKTSVTLTTPVLGVATGTSVNLSGDCRAATYHVGATAGASGTGSTIASITVVNGIVTAISVS
jgi:hypothetical protein